MHSSGCLLSTHAFACRRPVNDRSELLIFVRPNARDNAVQLSQRVGREGGSRHLAERRSSACRAGFDTSSVQPLLQV